MTPKRKVKKEKSIFTDQPPSKSPLYFYLIMISIPFLFFIVLELGLRIFNYGYDLSMWEEVAQGKLMLNPDAARRYFSNVKNTPSSIEDVFDKVKDKDAFRVFVLGGSSAAGYPYMPMGSFSRYIRRRLELNYPHKKIEVVNLSLTATNSFTIRDFIPEVINQKPDLILIYAGHNEYYGALGVGSLETGTGSREIINAMLFLNKFRTTQLIKNFLRWITSLIAKPENPYSSGTLMSRMAKEKYIAFNSETYKTGLKQFKENIGDVLRKLKEGKIPVIISTVASNIKDQPPFISTKYKNYTAQSVYNEAIQFYNKGNFKKADSLFRFAKDLDGLRFRAPEEINSIIRSLSKTYNVPYIDVDSLFSSISPNNIIGNNLMTDHLHPTLRGYQLIGKLFYDKMNEMNYLPDNSKPKYEYGIQDSITVSNFIISELDSTIADFRIKLLKNDWPFINPSKKKTIEEVCNPKTFIDTIAIEYLDNKLRWIQAHEKAANKYLIKNNLDGFLNHISALIYQYPFIKENFNQLEILAVKYLKNQDYKNAYKILIAEYKIKPNSFSSKWLGQIELNSGNIQPAIKFLEESFLYDSTDTQVIYNLSGAYALNKEYNKALTTVKKLLKLDSRYPGAQVLYNELLNIVSK
ncbi:MAG: GDSL-type esterase/lipase family protein [Melioribacter sp.]|uniref:GDSL-type esterase/lipase family protein n=1 Tax=Rosettibacter primus TaxID=3111523 RepID=UPI00247DD750|nr:GDSL-type esterase/lipase family protein [Melioribacter sp.]